MRRSKIMSMVLTMALIITSTLPGFVTASADNSFYDFKLHFVGEENSYEDVGIATIQGGQFSDGSWYQQLTPDKKDDVIIDVKIAPVREVSIAMYTSNWSQLGECTVPLSTFTNSNGSIEAWFIEGEGIVYSDPNDDGGTTTSQTSTTTTTSTTQSTTTTTQPTTTTTQPTTTTTHSTTTETSPADGYYKLVINAADSSDVGMIVVGGCQSKLVDGEPTWWHNYPANNDGVMLTVYVEPYNVVELSFLTSGWVNLGNATIPVSKFTSDTLNIWYMDGEIYYSDPSGGTGTTTTSTTATTTGTTTTASTTTTTTSATTTVTTATTATTTGTTSSTATPTTSTTTTTNTTQTTTTTPSPEGFYQKIEAEDAEMRGSVKVGTSRAGYSGTGYATGFDQSPNNGWSVNIDIPTSGHYKFTVSSAADSYKQNFLVLNGTSIATIVTEGTGEFETIVFDGIYIEAGTSTLSITESWGWFDLDYIIIESGEGIKSSVYTDIDTNLSNENSNAKTKAIWDYLVENYGERVISGQYAAHNSSGEIEAIYRETGKLPALRGFDFIFMSPNTDWHCEDETQLAIDWSNQGGLVSFSWHWHSPKGPHAFYTEDTDFDLAKGVTSLDVANMPLSEVKSLYESGQISEECYLLIHDIDAISEQLAKLERNNVTVLWRPIHEASGGWFWWGSAGPDAYKWLWRTMYERQTNFHNLGNLIWVWNAQSADWYVGDEYCDIVGYDVYAEYHNYSAQTDKFAESVEFSQGNKMVALSENAVMPDPDLMMRDNVYWSWFNVWYGDFIFDGYNLNGLYTEVDMVKKIYNHEMVITRDELPDFNS